MSAVRAYQLSRLPSLPVILLRSMPEGDPNMRSLSQIVSELEAQRAAVQRELDRLTRAINALRGANSSKSAGTITASGALRRPLSAAARKKIADAQRARWAAWKAKQKKVA